MGFICAHVHSPKDFSSFFLVTHFGCKSSGYALVISLNLFLLAGDTGHCHRHIQAICGILFFLSFYLMVTFSILFSFILFYPEMTETDMVQLYSLNEFLFQSHSLNEMLA